MFLKCMNTSVIFYLNLKIYFLKFHKNMHYTHIKNITYYKIQDTCF